jgi:hypothetical protein
LQHKTKKPTQKTKNPTQKTLSVQDIIFIKYFIEYKLKTVKREQNNLTIKKAALLW